jgi:hypothetical protein
MNFLGRPLHVDEENQIAEYIFGMVANRAGKELDTTRSATWQRGWAHETGTREQASISPKGSSRSRAVRP